MGIRVMVVDDEKLSRLTTAKQLASAGYEARPFDSPFAALQVLDQEHWDVVLSDLRMPGMDGLEFLKEIKSHSPETLVVLMTAYGTVQTAVEAMRNGAIDFLTKPFEFEELKVRLERIQEQLETRREITHLRRVLGSSLQYGGLIGSSPRMRQVFELIERFADSPSNVLVIGETGCGKELVARALHARSARQKGPFVALGCAAVPRELAESELFGHEAGAFTGATKRRKGRFEMAAGGTLFLDDVDDLPLELQAKLLRAIQEKQFERVGGEQTLHTDVRIIAATKSDLAGRTAEKRFREDLMYRLKVLEIEIPPLRERREDLLLLANHFLKRFAEEQGQTAKLLSPQAQERLLSHPWPGNVRELQHALEYAQAVSRTPEILMADLPANLRPAIEEAPYTIHLEGKEKVDFRGLLESIERHVLHWALTKCSGHQGRAAEMLGLPRTTLQSRLVEKLEKKGP